MLTTILLLLAAFNLVMMAVFAIAAWRARYPTRERYVPTVSIIIAARNEEENIAQCLDTVAGLTYPRERMEVIVVNDRSTDATEIIAQGYVRRLPHLKLITAVPGSGNLRGKANAVTQGIDVASGEILLFTDADCLVPREWVHNIVKYYADDVGIVAGFTSLEGKGRIACAQALDWLGVFSLAAGLIRIGLPATAVGTNLSVRRSAYDEVGGYRKIPFSVTEDYALFNAITTRTRYRARFPLETGSLVVSKPCLTWRELYRQRKRWFLGGRGMDARFLMLFAFPYLFFLLLPVGLLTGPGETWWAALGMKLLADTLMVLPPLVTFKKFDLLPCIPLFALYLLVYVLVFPVVVVFGRGVIWKERSFRH